MPLQRLPAHAVKLVVGVRAGGKPCPALLLKVGGDGVAKEMATLSAHSGDVTARCDASDRGKLRADRRVDRGSDRAHFVGMKATARKRTEPQWQGRAAREVAAHLQLVNPGNSQAALEDDAAPHIVALHRGYTYLASQQIKKAIAAFREAVDLKRDDAMGY